MAVKKTKTPKTEVVEEVTVETSEAVEVAKTTAEEPVEEPIVEEVIEDTPTVEIEAPKEVSKKQSVTVDTESVSKSDALEETKRIRMRVDHKCTIAMQRYDLKKGQCYNVPENVKRILDMAGLLAPL